MSSDQGVLSLRVVDLLEKLQHPSLPPHEAFFSSLTNTNISVEEYQYCQQVWSSNNMQTLREFLIWYNNLDVQPFCDALDKMCAFWRRKNIDMLRQGISIPGVTLTYLFATLEPGIFFSLFDEKNKDLYSLFKRNMVGGPSIVFHCYHEKEKTKIREKEMKAQQKDPKFVRRSWDMTRMHYISVPLCNTCLLDHLQEEGRKLGLKKKVPSRWQRGG